MNTRQRNALVVVLVALVTGAVVVAVLYFTSNPQDEYSPCPEGMTLTEEDDVWTYEVNGEPREHPITYQTCE